jgi:hypothetical protein
MCPFEGPVVNWDFAEQGLSSENISYANDIGSCS